MQLQKVSRRKNEYFFWSRRQIKVVDWQLPTQSRTDDGEGGR
jgi:hypothetical protein